MQSERRPPLAVPERGEEQMVRAWLVMNRFIHSEKFRLLREALTFAAATEGVDLFTLYNTDLAAKIRIDGTIPSDALWRSYEKPDFVIFWDKDIRLAKALEGCGLRLFNSAESIEICDDKAETFLALRAAGIPMPETYLAPMTFRPDGLPSDEMEPFLLEMERKLGYPMILKGCYGSFGLQVFLVQDRRELVSCMGQFENRPFVFQRYIAASRGRDLRVQTVGSRVVAVAERSNPDDFRANVTNGGHMRACPLPAAAQGIVQSCVETLHLDFAGIDLLYDGEGGFYLCEVNSNAHFINLDQACGSDTGRAIFCHLCTEMGLSKGERE